MGGLGGHMNHLYDNRDLTFKEMKEIFEAAASGKLSGTEKTDGQNLYISYSIGTGKAKAARNKSNIKSGGMDAVALANKFAGRGNLTSAFVDSFTAFEKTVKTLSLKNQFEIFGKDADIFYSAEIMDPRNSNVINYDKKTLLIHQTGHAKFNKDTGNVEDIDVTTNVKALNKAMSDLIGDESIDYTVKMNSVRKLKAIADGSVVSIAQQRIDGLLSDNNLTDDATVGLYVLENLDLILSNNRLRLDLDKKKMFLRKLYGDKGLKINAIKKGLDEETQSKIDNIYKNKDELLKRIIEPLEDIVHDFSVAVLKGMRSAFVLSNSKEVSRLKDEVSKAIKDIQNSGSEESNIFLQKHLKKLKDIENISTASEGFVFDYNGKLYKFTGNFAPINQILGFYKYGRADKVNENEVMELNENDRGERTAYFVWGRMNPPHMGHKVLLDSAAKNSKKERSDYFIFLTKTVNKKKDPIPYEHKIKIFQSLFPEYKDSLVTNVEIKTMTDALMFLQSKGYNKVRLVVGSDQVQPFEWIINNNGKTDNKSGNVYEFDDIDIVSGGQRDNSDGVAGLSATKLRNAASANDFDTFYKFYPDKLSVEFVRSIFSLVKNGMGIKENLNLDKYINKLIEQELKGKLI